MIEYSRITEDDIEEIISLTEKNLTEGSVIGDEIRNAVKNGRYYGMKATLGNEIIGFVTNRDGIELTFPHPELEEKYNKMFGDKRITTGDAIFVNEKYRRSGVGQSLVTKIRNITKSKKYDIVFTELWVYADGDFPVGAIKNGGEMIFEEKIPMFYKDLPKYGMQCPICGRDCKCSAVIRIYKVED